MSNAVLTCDHAASNAMRRPGDPAPLAHPILLLGLVAATFSMLVSTRSASADVLVKGEVRETSDTPVVGARVTVMDRHGNSLQGNSDAGGKFALSFATQAGSVRCRIARDGYADAFYVLVVQDGTADASAIYLRPNVGLDRPVISGVSGGGLLVELLLHNDSAASRSLREVRVKGTIGTDASHVSPTPLMTFHVGASIEVTASGPGRIEGVGSAAEPGGLAREIPITVEYRASSGGTFELAVSKAIPLSPGPPTGLTFILPAALEANVPVPGQASMPVKVEFAACTPTRADRKCKETLHVQALMDGGAVIHAPPAPLHVRVK